MASQKANGATHKFDPNFTQNVIDAIGPKAAPRARQVIGSLIQHLHDFARENEITVDEWMSAVDFVSTEISSIKTSSFGANKVR
jgi:catechol 1,2-dioxygenase